MRPNPPSKTNGAGAARLNARSFTHRSPPRHRARRARPHRVRERLYPLSPRHNRHDSLYRHDSLPPRLPQHSLKHCSIPSPHPRPPKTLRKSRTFFAALTLCAEPLCVPCKSAVLNTAATPAPLPPDRPPAPPLPMACGVARRGGVTSAATSGKMQNCYDTHMLEEQQTRGLSPPALAWHRHHAGREYRLPRSGSVACPSSCSDPPGRWPPHHGVSAAPDPAKKTRCRSGPSCHTANGRDEYGRAAHRRDGATRTAVRSWADETLSVRARARRCARRGRARTLGAKPRNAHGGTCTTVQWHAHVSTCMQGQHAHAPGERAACSTKWSTRRPD